MFLGAFPPGFGAYSFARVFARGKMIQMEADEMRGRRKRGSVDLSIGQFGLDPASPTTLRTRSSGNGWTLIDNKKLNLNF